MNDQYWHGAGYESFMAECIEDQRQMDADERIARGAIACEADWQAREWAVLVDMAAKKGLAIHRGDCGHSELFNAGQEPNAPAPCTRCLLREAVTA